VLASFLGVLPILTPPLCALAFIMCSKSNPIVVFALDLMSTYEGEHTIFGLLGHANENRIFKVIVWLTYSYIPFVLILIALIFLASRSTKQSTISFFRSSDCDFP
jgi:hypothetical protein